MGNKSKQKQGTKWSVTRNVNGFSMAGGVGWRVCSECCFELAEEVRGFLLNDYSLFPADVFVWPEEE
jgi:hypothetical protein